MQGLQGHGRALERRGSLRGRRAELRLQHCDQPRARCGGPSMLRPPLPQSACAALSSTLAASMQLLHAAPAAPCSCSAAQAARVCPTAGCLAACSAAYLAACMSVMVSPLRRMRPSALRVFRFTAQGGRGTQQGGQTSAGLPACELRRLKWCRLPACLPAFRCRRLDGEHSTLAAAGRSTAAERNTAERSPATVVPRPGLLCRLTRHLLRLIQHQVHVLVKALRWLGSMVAERGQAALAHSCSTGGATTNAAHGGKQLGVPPGPGSQ